MASKLAYLFHTWVFPDAKLVINEPVRRKNFFIIGVPLEGTDLGISLDFIHHLPVFCVPKFDGLVSGSSSRSKEVFLPRTPGEGFDSCLVVIYHISWPQNLTRPMD